ncbi:helix-turn-helix domain-containing protein [Bacillus sp. FJAT-49711]|uniref:response regulator transcription factor n=1 Tax=Bacillus sp. FJAT-49711 TaxID=2833585 RepID=UPI001BC9093F|nr:helix-turn-helix domain-containing protein [Bacillus sp. FJAT-49711]MBS4218334.1 helix-turn-helix domain-containing protein [Bacillus sp. FJAT-49711]
MTNMNVLIVDDEVHAVRGILAGVDWEALEVVSVYTAHNKKQAKSIFEQHHIDLLLSDIDMPKGSGIELLSWVREHHPYTEAIFISCHSEFTFAKQAVKLKSLNYLLKPIDYKELEEEIKEAFRKIQENRNLNHLEESFLHLQEVHRSNQKETFWRNLIDEMISSSEKEINYYLGKYEMKFDINAGFLPILAHIQYTHNEELLHRNEIKIKASQYVQTEIMKIEPNVTMIQLSQSHLLFISEKLVDHNQIVNHCEQIITQCRQSLYMDVCFYIGEQSPLNNMVSVVHELKKMDKNNVLHTNKTFTIGHHNSSYFTPNLPKSTWIELMKNGSKDKILDEIQQFITSWKIADMNVTRNSLHVFYQDFLQIIFYLLQAKGLEANKVFSNKVLLNELENIGTIDDFKEWILFLTTLTMEQIHPNEDSYSVVDKVKEFINENISIHKLTRDDIANHVYLNPDYLTRIFKKQTGVSISTYMQHVRMEKAKQLLTQTELPISTIGLECGYTNFSYFSTLFKNYTHLNPMEFRRTFMNQES